MRRGAAGTGAAGPHQSNQHRITHRIAFDARADIGDGSGRLVAINRRQMPAPAAIGIGDIRITDRTGGQFDLDLARLGRGQSDFLDAERCAEFAADSGPCFGHVRQTPFVFGGMLITAHRGLQVQIRL